MKTPKRYPATMSAYASIDELRQDRARWKRKNKIAQLKHTITKQKQTIAWMLELLNCRMELNNSAAIAKFTAISEFLRIIKFKDNPPELVTKADINRLLACPPHKRREKIREMREFNRKLACAEIYTNTMIYPDYVVRDREEIKSIYESNPYKK